MRTFAALHLRRALRQPVASALTLAVVAFATAAFVGVFALRHSVVGSVEGFTAVARGAEFELRALTAGGFDDRLLEAASGIPGVDTAAPVVEAPVLVAGREVTLLGIDARAGALSPELEAAIAEAEEEYRSHPGDLLGGVFPAQSLAQAAGVRPGDTLTIYAGGARHRTRVLDIADSSPAAGIDAGMVVIAVRPHAQDLSGRPGRLDSILVVVEPGADSAAIERRLAALIDRTPGVALGAPADRIAQVAADVDGLESLLFSIAFLVALVAAVVISSTARMVSVSRQRELGMLHALGADVDALRRGFLGEIALLALVGAGVGVAMGGLAARAAVDSLPPLVASTIGAPVLYSFPATVIPAALVIAPLVTVLASRGPAARAVALDPVDAMRPEAARPNSPDPTPVRAAIALAGAALVAVGFTLLAVGVERAPQGVPTAALLGGITVATWAVLGPMAVAMAAVVRRLGAAGAMAATAIRREPRRVWTAVIAIALAVAAGITIGGVARNGAAAADRVFGVQRDIDLVVQTAPPDGLASDVLMGPEWRTRLMAVNGVTRVTPLRFEYVTLPAGRTVVTGVTTGSLDPMLVSASAEARAAVAAGAAVIVNRGLAQDQGLGTGDLLRIPTPAGDRRLPVADVVDVVRGLANRAVAVSLPALEDWLGVPGASRYEVSFAPGANPTVARDRVEGVLAAAPFSAEVFTGDDLADASAGIVNQILSVFLTMQWVVLAGAGLATLNTLALSVGQRRRELAVARGLGATRRQVLASVALEGATIGAAGIAIGVALGTALHRAVVSAARDLTSFPFEYSVEPLAIPLAAGVALAAALAGALVAVRPALAGNPSRALAVE